MDIASVGCLLCHVNDDELTEVSGIVANNISSFLESTFYEVTMTSNSRSKLFRLIWLKICAFTKY